MFAKSTVAFALLAGFVAAQTSTPNSTIDPNSIPLTTRNQWCQGQQNTCGTLCSGSINNNTCDPTGLTFSCLCASNNSEPGLQYYTQTLPTFVCEQIFTNCNLANVGDAAGQALCLTNEKKNCGGNNPDNFTAAATTSTTSMSSTATSATSASAATGSVTTTSTSKAAGATLAAMRNFGTGAIAIGVGAAFGYML